MEKQKRKICTSSTKKKKETDETKNRFCVNSPFLKPEFCKISTYQIPVLIHKWHSPRDVKFRVHIVIVKFSLFSKELVLCQRFSNFSFIYIFTIFPETISSAATDDSSFSTTEEGREDRAAPPSPTYGHFSKAPEERENILEHRRNVMLRQARVKYLNKTLRKQPESGPSVTRSSESCHPSETEDRKSREQNARDLGYTSSQPNIRLRYPRSTLTQEENHNESDRSNTETRVHFSDG